MSKTVVIDRHKWYCPENIEQEYDYLPRMKSSANGLYCCLGFWAKQCKGLTDKSILDMADPSDMEGFGRGIKKWQDAAISANDDWDIANPEERERKVKSAFKRAKINVEFVGKYRKKKVHG